MSIAHKLLEMDILSRLPNELLLQITEYAPELRFASRRFYLVHNDCCKHKLLKLVPFAQTKKLEPFFRQYLETLEFWNGALQTLVAPDLIWWIPLSFLSNRKVFFQKCYTSIQTAGESTDQFQLEDFETLKVEKANTFHYKQDVYLPAGGYSFQLALHTRRGTRGLGTMRFSLQGPDLSLTQYAPTYIVEMMPPDVPAVLNLGTFTVVGDNCGETLTKYTMELEEQGMYQKTQLEFEYIDFKRCTTSTGEEPLFYTMKHGFPLSDAERQVHVAIELVLQGRDLGAALALKRHDATDQLPEQFYTTGQRAVRMMNPNAQTYFVDKHKSVIKHWKVPF